MYVTSVISRLSHASGIYGEQINAVAWSVQQLLNTIESVHQERTTLVMFVSDHGPHREICLHGGETGYFRGKHRNQWSLILPMNNLIDL